MGRKNLLRVEEMELGEWEDQAVEEFVIKQVSVILKGFKFVSDLTGIKLETNNRKLCEQVPNIWEQNSMLLNSLWVKEEIKIKIRKYLEPNKIKIQHITFCVIQL